MPPQQTKHLDLDSSTISAGGVNGGTRPSKGIEVGSCNINEIGLESFIRRIVNEIDLHITEDCHFNLNDRAVMHKWKDVFEIEQVYTKCLGISERLYRCHSYTHEVDNRLTYFILEEFNKRSYSFLPDFKYYVLIFCWYDENRGVCEVSVQYDQMSFFLHCMGITNMTRWILSNISTPPAKLWAKAFAATGCVNPITFLLFIALFVWGVTKLCSP
jgi:hypothetical protein